jgi:large subunit ribosomal protein L18
LLAGKKALSAGVSSAVLDIGLAAPTKGSRVFATLKGMVDAGLDIPYSEDVVPSEERIRGEHIGDEMKTQFDTVKAQIQGVK